MSTSPTPPSTNQPRVPGDPTDPPLGPTRTRARPDRQWGTSPTPPGPKPKRRGRILLAAAIGVALLVTTGFVANSGTPDPRPAPTPPTTPSPGPADPPGDDPARDPIPEGTQSPSRSRSRRESRSPSWSA